jgi:hypothetical protein
MHSNSELITIQGNPEREAFFREVFEREPAWLRGMHVERGFMPEYHRIVLEIDRHWEGDLVSELQSVTRAVMQDRDVRKGRYSEVEQPI